LRGRDAVVQGIETRKLFERMMPNILAAGATGPASTAIAETYGPALKRWLVENVIAEEADSDNRIGGMVEGVWVGPDQEAQRPDRPSGAVLPRISANSIEDSELQCLDLVQVPTVEPPNDWAWAVLSTAATTTYMH